MRKVNRFVLIFGLFISVASCQKEVAGEYIFLGHPYDYNRVDRLDPRAEQLLTYPFDQVWFGGDVCAQMAASQENIAYMDSLFQAIPGEIHWALGNHDINFGPIEEVLKWRDHPPFYTVFKDGICLLVLNTNLFWLYPGVPSQKNCTEKEAQLSLIRTVADTLRDASHLVVLHHHGLFTELLTDSTGNNLNPFNVNALSIRATCDSASFINEWIYPEMIKVQQRGIQVIFIGGDVGMTAKEFSFRTQEGILILGSGINNSLPKEYAPEYVTTFDPDKVLWLKHWPAQKKLEWRFMDLDSLLERTNSN